MCTLLPNIGAFVYNVDMTTQEDVTTWAGRAREATAKRDDTIRALRSEGASLRAIGRAAGMSPAGVRRVLDRGTDGER